MLQHPIERYIAAFWSCIDNYELWQLTLSERADNGRVTYMYIPADGHVPELLIQVVFFPQKTEELDAQVALVLLPEESEGVSLRSPIAMINNVESCPLQMFLLAAAISRLVEKTNERLCAEQQQGH